jgi:hypothetical protein
MKPPTHRWSPKNILFSALFACIALFIIAGPGIRQIGGSKSVVFRNWVMYSGFGRKFCQVDYFTMTDSGEKFAVNRFELLNATPWYKASRSIRRIPDKKSVENMGRRLCARLPKGSDLRVVSRCASRSYWKPAHDGSTPLCTLARPPRIRAPKLGPR